jgi:short-subunit dehydrogenase
MSKKFALITGASEGLGKFLSIECAMRKMDLLLVALPGSNLESIARYIRNGYGVDVVCHETNLSEEKNCHHLYHWVKEQGISISVLINNAGMGGTFFFDERSPEYYSTLISLNVLSPTLLCRLFLEDLKKNAPSFVMNVGSLAGIFHLPQKQVYGGTKSYLLAFSKSLRKELKKDKVSVSVLCPGGMNTYWRLMMENRTTGTWVSRQSIMEPSEVAAISIRKLFEKKGIIIPGLWNRSFLFWNKLFPSQVKDCLVEYQMARRIRHGKINSILQPELITIKKLN